MLYFLQIIVADMRKVLAKNPHIEQQKLHRRVFFEKIDPKNQALMVIIHWVIPSFGWNTIIQSVLTKNCDQHWYIFFRCRLSELPTKDPLPYIVIFGFFIFLCKFGLFTYLSHLIVFVLSEIVVERLLVYFFSRIRRRAAYLCIKENF